MWFYPEATPTEEQKNAEKERRHRLEQSVGDFDGWGISEFRDDETARRVRRMLGLDEPIKEKK